MRRKVTENYRRDFSPISLFSRLDNKSSATNVTILETGRYVRTNNCGCARVRSTIGRERERETDRQTEADRPKSESQCCSSIQR